MTRRGRGRPDLRIAVPALLLLAAGALVLVSSPRHRAFYLGPPDPGVAADGPARPGLALASPAAASPARTPVSGARVPEPDQAGRLRVPVSDALPRRLPAVGTPAGWAVTVFAGEAAVELVRDEGRVAVRLRSERTSFALHRDVVVDLRQHPVLSWSWKVRQLPAGGDVRESGRDDQAAQVYVVFPRWPAPRSRSDVIGYVWDGRAPPGTTLPHPRAPNVKVIVLQSGPARLDTWVHERRNVAEDYRALFRTRPPRVGKLALMIDSNDTRSAAEALFRDLLFATPAASQHSEIPTPMLR